MSISGGGDLLCQGTRVRFLEPALVVRPGVGRDVHAPASPSDG